MTYLNNIHKYSDLLKNNNSFSGDNRQGLVEKFAVLLIIGGAIIVFISLYKIIKHVMSGHDPNNANNAAEEFPLQQEMMNGDIPNNRDDNIGVLLMAEEAV